MKSITVFCGSNVGFDNRYKAEVIKSGIFLAKEKIEIVYGGASVGLMGVLAETVINNGGKVIGVLPKFLCDKEPPYERLTELILVDTMHERKVKMYELSEGIMALPGGYGTIEELFEILTWGQLGLHKKPVAILNINEFYNSLKTFIDKMVEEGFLTKENREMLLISNSISELIVKMKVYKPPVSDKWVKN